MEAKHKKVTRRTERVYRRTLINVLGVVYVHTKTSDGGDLYMTRYAEQYQKHFDIGNWYDPEWFNTHKIRLEGTGSVYRVPTKEVDGKVLDLVVKNCRVGEDVPLDTHTLQEFCDAEFNSAWEEFSLVTEMREGQRPEISENQHSVSHGDLCASGNNADMAERQVTVKNKPYSGTASRDRP